MCNLKDFGHVDGRIAKELSKNSDTVRGFFGQVPDLRILLTHRFQRFTGVGAMAKQMLMERACVAHYKRTEEEI